MPRWTAISSKEIPQTLNLFAMTWPLSILLLIISCSVTWARLISKPKDVDNGCDLEQSYTSSNTGAVFDISCDTCWFDNDRKIYFTSDLGSCLDYCADWNVSNPPTDKCVGATWVEGEIGPQGDTSACYLKWQLNGNGTVSPGFHTGRLLNASTIATQVHPFF